MNLKKVKRIMWILVGAAAMTLFIAALTGSFFFTVAGVVLCFAFLSLNQAQWRCPYCGAYLGRYSVKTCPYCGETLEDLEDKPAEEEQNSQPKEDNPE